MDPMESSASETSSETSPKTPSAASVQAPDLINWELAASTAARLTPAGPVLGSAEIGAAVENLRLMADISVPHVHHITGLDAARDLRDSEVLVVDRASWAKANTQSFAVMLKPAMGKLLEGRGSLSPGAAGVSAAITGSQLGAILAFLSSKVLGQYDPFSALAENSTAPASGRLLLVAPNIISVERELKVEPADFRLWVCLHEQTHRVQFAAAPWLRHHMLQEIENLSGLLLGNVDSLMERASAAAKSLKDRAAPGAAPGRGAILDLLQNPEEKAALSRLTALMSLLEGHANVVMDAVDASIVPSVKTIRQRFNDRGQDRGMIEKFIRNLLGLDAKMRQYSDGAKFVREVVAAAGMEGFNRVWESAGPPPQRTRDPRLQALARPDGPLAAMTAPDGAGSTSISSGRRRPGRLAPVVGTARKMLQDALAAAGYPDRVLVACSGGPDSLALAAVAAYFARRGHVDGHPVSVGAVVVDHQLQPGSAGVAATTARTLEELGLSPVTDPDCRRRLHRRGPRGRRPGRPPCGP